MLVKIQTKIQKVFLFGDFEMSFLLLSMSMISTALIYTLRRMKQKWNAIIGG